MGRFVKGEVVVLPFPFSDLSASNRRPALVVAPLDGNDLLLCMITSQPVRDPYAVSISKQDFAQGSLQRDSHVRPSRLFTADGSIIVRSAGRLKPVKLKAVIDAIVRLVTQ
jgi:mRNA interferase MazF